MEFRLDYRRYRLPFRSPVRTARGNWQVREGLYVRLGAPDGTVGFGEASPLPAPATESVDDDEAFCRSLGGHVDSEVIDRVPKELCSLRNSIWNAMGGGETPRHKSLGIAALLPAGRAALEKAPERADMGFRVFKWKVGVGPADDEMALFDDLIAALPQGSRMRLDANGAWNTRTAQKWLDRCADRPVEFVEQPVEAGTKGSVDQLLGLSADYPVPIALDESIGADRDVAAWIDVGWPGYFVIKPALLGDAPGVLARLQAAKAKVVFSSSLETAMGAQSALRQAFSWPADTPALGFGVWPLFSDPVFDGPHSVPFLRIEDVERIEPETLWNAVK